jgi:hypothetical protein
MRPPLAIIADMEGSVMDKGTTRSAVQTKGFGQARLGAVQGLDLGLLIDTEDHGVGGRIDIQADDVADLGGELRIVGKLEGVDPVRG